MTVDTAKSFFKTIYLGDRACMGYVLDSFREEFSLVVDEISRIRAADGQWNYYNDENIENGRLTFSGVSFLSFGAPGLIPNDYIELAGIEPADSGIRFRFELGCVGPDALSSAMRVDVVARDCYLESPAQPGVQIR